jgi:hypothetical protein
VALGGGVCVAAVPAAESAPYLEGECVADTRLYARDSRQTWVNPVQTPATEHSR